MNKNIEKIELVMENGEGIIIPIECIKKLNLDTKNIETVRGYMFIKKVEMIIKNSHDIIYKTYQENKDNCIIDRLHNINDITSIIYRYKNNKAVPLVIDWFGSENPYFASRENLNQRSAKIKDDSIHIKIEPFIN